MPRRRRRPSAGLSSLSNAGHNFCIADGAAAEDLLISATIAGGGSNQAVLTKTGAGVLVLSGNNSFQGRVTVAYGTLDIRSSTALGVADNTANNETTVNAGATLRLNPGVGEQPADGERAADAQLAGRAARAAVTRCRTGRW